MDQQAQARTWFGPIALDAGSAPSDKPHEFERLWRGFMTARVTLGLVLLALQAVIYRIGASSNTTALMICTAYLALALSVRLLASPRPLGQTLDIQWIAIIGVDMLAFSALQATQDHSINYAPLLALPILMASVLGPLLLALGAAAGSTLLLFVYVTWQSVQSQGEVTAPFLQAALTGAGYFVISFLAHQMASRLANVELSDQRSQLAIRVQRQVNELVIESLTDGVLVIDPNCMVRAANPAARQLLGADAPEHDNRFHLEQQPGWRGLLDLAQLSFSARSAQQAEVAIHHAGQGPRRVRVRTQLTSTTGGGDEPLCVMFVQDQREIEARMRTERLASMGRMSAAVAHEIRNPLSAIAQANALLDEDLSEPRHKLLTSMVQKNTQRLEKIVSDVLDVSGVRRRHSDGASDALELNQAVSRICLEWQQQTSSGQRLHIELARDKLQVNFDAEHLRRILVNLLDNARRYASDQAQTIQVGTAAVAGGQAALRVWSDGVPMDQSVERHLFEPFFSSESRSSGLGLYICRELCEKQGASIAYCRAARNVNAKLIEGNEFSVLMRTQQP